MPQEKEVQEPMPQDIAPMLCTLLRQPFTDANYIYEVKWDDYRIIAYKLGTVKLQSRGGHNYTNRYPSIVAGLEAINHDFVLDGEVVAINSQGKPDFNALQKVSGQTSGVLYYAFDLLWLDGKNLMKLPLLKRKSLLKEVIATSATIKYSDYFEDGHVLFEHIEALELEGIVAKRKDSLYMPGKRGKDWYKIPAMQEDDFVIGGYVESKKRLFRTLLFGFYEGDQLKWLGHAGGGYKEHEMPTILKRLQALEIPESPFVNEVDYQGIVHWVKPELVAKISYATFTKAGKIRKPAIFLGFQDKDLNETKGKNITKAGQQEKNFKKDAGNAKGDLPAASGSNWPKVEAEVVKNGQRITVDGCTVRLYNVERKLWKELRRQI